MGVYPFTLPLSRRARFLALGVSALTLLITIALWGIVVDSLALSRRYSIPILIQFVLIGGLVGLIVLSGSAARRYAGELDTMRNDLRRMVDCSPVPMLIHDQDGRIHFVNDAWFELTGFDETDLHTLQYWLLELLNVDEADTHHAFLHDQHQNVGCSRITWEAEIRTKSGEKRTWLLTSVPLKKFESSNDPRMIVATDLTEREATRRLRDEHEALQHAVHAMERVLGVVGHELRTPLAAVRAMSEFILEHTEAVPVEVNDLVHSIHDETIRMANLVHNMLEVTRLNSGHAQWHWSHVSLRDACERSLRSVEPLVDQSNVALEFNVIPDDLSMDGDADAIERLIINLVNNAAKHTRKGSIRVTCAPGSHEPGKWVRISVEDTGVGIEDATVSRLGEAFVLNEGAIGTEFIRGSGLGLAICRGVVAAHGGSIAVATHQGRGTRFTVMLRADLPCSIDVASEAVPIRREAA